MEAPYSELEALPPERRVSCGAQWSASFCGGETAHRPGPGRTLGFLGLGTRHAPARCGVLFHSRRKERMPHDSLNAVHAMLPEQTMDHQETDGG